MELRELIVQSELHVLPQILDFIRQACQQAGLSDRATFACELAADEACTNIIEHAYAGRADGDIRIACWAAHGQFIIQFNDHGAAFDPTAIHSPALDAELEARPVGRLGMHFMRTLMDDVSYEFDLVTGNRLTLSKRL